jgi:hypothetical protein
MQSNQSIHLTIKQPPNPKPIRTIGIFDDPDNPAIRQVIDHFLNTLDFEPKSKEFSDNVKDEVLKLITTQKPIAVAKKGTLTLVYFQE